MTPAKFRRGQFVRALDDDGDGIVKDNIYIIEDPDAPNEEDYDVSVTTSSSVYHRTLFEPAPDFGTLSKANIQARLNEIETLVQEIRAELQSYRGI